MADGPASADDPTVRVGCADVPAGVTRDQYQAALGYLELGGGGRSLPGAAALRRRRREAPESFAFGLLTSGVDDAAGAAVAEAVDALGAEVVVFRSPAEITPSTASRDRLRRFFGEVVPAERLHGAARAWLPHGLWQPQAAARLASELDVMLVCDPLARDPFGEPPEFYAQLGEAAYFRMTGIGGGRRFAAHELELVAALAAGYPRAWLVLDNPGRFQDAVRLRALIAGGAA